MPSHPRADSKPNNTADSCADNFANDEPDPLSQRVAVCITLVITHNLANCDPVACTNTLTDAIAVRVAHTVSNGSPYHAAVSNPDPEPIHIPKPVSHSFSVFGSNSATDHDTH
jgi:hypothetical protein